MFLLILAAFCIYAICKVCQEQKHHKEVAILKLKQQLLRGTKKP